MQTQDVSTSQANRLKSKLASPKKSGKGGRSICSNPTDSFPTDGASRRHRASHLQGEEDHENRKGPRRHSASRLQSELGTWLRLKK